MNDKVIDFNQARDLAKAINKAKQAAQEPELVEDVILGNMAVMFDGDYHLVMQYLLIAAVRLASQSYPEGVSMPNTPLGARLNEAGDDKFTCALIYEPLVIDDDE